MKKVLIVVDYQVDFVSGSLGFPGAELLDEKIAAKIEAYLQQGQDVIYTLDTHETDYLHTQEGQNLPISHCLRGTKGWQVYGKTGTYLPQAAAVVEKPVFGSLELGTLLQRESYDQVELVGLVSNICVISNAVIAKAALPEAKIVVDARCTASADQPLHQAALQVMTGLQIQVTDQ